VLILAHGGPVSLTKIKTKDKLIRFKLSPDLSKAISRLAKMRGCIKSGVAVAILKKWLKKEGYLRKA
jgi:hypothetical protein